MALTASLSPTMLATILFVAMAVIVFSLRNPLFLLAAHILSRGVLDSMPVATYQHWWFGLSYMQFYSAAFIPVAFGIAWFNGHRFRDKENMPYIVLITASLLTTVLQQSWSGFFEVGFKWLYLWALVGLVMACMQKNSEKRVLLILWLALLYPMGNQLYWAIFGSPLIESGQVSYQGTYFHNSDLGFLIFASLSISFLLLTRIRGVHWKVLIIAVLVYAHIGLYINNYRTILVALGVFWILRIIILYSQEKAIGKVGVLSGGLALITLVIAATGAELGERLADIWVFLSDPGEYLDFSGKQHQRVGLLSGRIDIINAYLYQYVKSSFEVWILGIGPEVGSSIVGTYAHNEFISALVEGGVVGLMALFYFIVRSSALFLKETRLKGSASWIGLATFIALAVSALGTMPFRNMRAMMLLGIIIGWAAWHTQQSSKKAKGGSPKTKPMDDQKTVNQ
ncbi:MAG: hypothetical protein H6968_18290 [Chromatiaceae bacterium]|nr:hypothetical protein [Chromatiaceae bacterium]